MTAMTTAHIIGPQWYRCPNCGLEDRRPPIVSGSHMHNCPALRGLIAPLVLGGVSAKVEAVDRGDYVGAEHGVRLDGTGRAIQSVITTRNDGQDCAVFAPTATVNASTNLEGA